MNKVNHLLFLSCFSLSLCLLMSCCKGDNEDDVIIEIGEEASSAINYTITISPDLLKFVTPQVNYVDENGNIVTITGIEDLDGKVIESKAEAQKEGIHASVWTSQVITGTGYKCWTVKMRYNRLDFHSFMSVKYLRNDFVEDTTNKTYDFHHNVNTSVSTIKQTEGSIKVNVDSYSTITIGNYLRGDEIELYLSNLVDNPDRVGFFVDSNGNITREEKKDP